MDNWVMLRAVMTKEKALTDWEKTFIEHVAKRMSDGMELTGKQPEMLYKIWQKVCKGHDIVRRYAYRARLHSPDRVKQAAQARVHVIDLPPEDFKDHATRNRNLEIVKGNGLTVYGGFSTGDGVLIRELFYPDRKDVYTGRKLRRRITSVQSDHPALKPYWLIIHLIVEF